MNDDQYRKHMIDTGQPEAMLVEAEANREQTWTMAELQAEFEVMGFAAPLVVVRRKADGKVGTLMFTHSPRVYYGWQEDTQ